MSVVFYYDQISMSKETLLFRENKLPAPFCHTMEGKRERGVDILFGRSVSAFL